MPGIGPLSSLAGASWDAAVAWEGVFALGRSSGQVGEAAL